MIANGRLTLRAFYNDYYQPLRLRGRSSDTRRLYEFSIRNFGKFLGREPLLDDLSDDNVARLIAWMRERGRTAATANKERAQLLAIWRFAVRKKLSEDWPNVDPEIEPERIPNAWTQPQIDRLFAACLATPGLVGPVNAGLWWYAMHLVGWDTGERITPIRQLRWSWLDWDSGLLLVPAEVRKGRRRDRLYPLHPETLDALRGIRQPVRQEIFPWPYSANYIYSKYAAVQRRAGVPVGREFRFHCLRRSVASHGKAAGLDPQELMDHANSRTTKKYLDPRICGQRSASQVLFRPKAGKPQLPPLLDPQGRLFDS